MHLLQVCNVGDICGGTAACAWTITRALPHWRHSVLFRTAATEETLGAFAECEVIGPCESQSISAEVALLHNTPRSFDLALNVQRRIHYLHSSITPCPSDVQIVCSHWLQSQRPWSDRSEVMTQPVPKPLGRDAADARPLRERLVVGRICTPRPRKWPMQLATFYERLASRFERVDWEFVGCPAAMQVRLQEACRGRARFLPAGWMARRRLWQWDLLLYHHPTLTESFGRVTAEAMRAGCIPVVDDRGGFREQIAPGTGWLCSTVNDFEMALDAMTDAGMRRQMSRHAQSHADQAFSLRGFAERFQRLCC